MWFFGNRAAAKEVVIQLKVNGVGVKEKTARKAIKKALNKISKEEMELLIKKLRHKEWGELRVTLVECGKLKRMPGIFISSEGPDIIPREQYDCCGQGYTCGVGCAFNLSGTDIWSDTNLGLIPDSETDAYSEKFANDREEDQGDW